MIKKRLVYYPNSLLEILFKSLMKTHQQLPQERHQDFTMLKLHRIKYGK